MKSQTKLVLAFLVLFSVMLLARSGPTRLAYSDSVAAAIHVPPQDLQAALFFSEDVRAEYPLAESEGGPLLPVEYGHPYFIEEAEFMPPWDAQVLPFISLFNYIFETKGPPEDVYHLALQIHLPDEADYAHKLDRVVALPGSPFYNHEYDKNGDHALSNLELANWVFDYRRRIIGDSPIRKRDDDIY